MYNREYTIQDAPVERFQDIGKLMVDVYSQIEGFPNKKEFPDYYTMLANIGDITKNKTVRLLIATSKTGDLGGAVVYFSDMALYGSGGTATKEKNAAGFRLLAVNPNTRGKGIGKLLSKACIQIAQTEKQKQLIIHSTKTMQVAWNMYEKLGFKRSLDLDFVKGELAVYGFRLVL